MQSDAERATVAAMHPEGVGHRLEVCDTDSLIKESKDYCRFEWLDQYCIL